MSKRQFTKKIKETFGYDVADASTYVNMESTELIPQLVESSTFLSKVTVDQECTKNTTKKIKIFDVTMDIEALTACDVSDSGGAIDFSEVNLTPSLVGSNDFYCNDDLNAKWTALLLAKGAKAGLEELPASQQVTAVYAMLLKKKVEDKIWLADTDAVSPTLNMFDGLLKQFKNDPNIPAFANVGAVSASNALSIFKGVARTVSSKVYDNDITFDILCSQTDFEFLIDNLLNDNNYSYTAEVQGEGNDRSIAIPGTSARAVIQRQLSTGEIYAVPYQYVAVGTDASTDLDAISVDFLQEQLKLRVSTRMFLDVAYARPEYFAKYDEVAS